MNLDEPGRLLVLSKAVLTDIDSAAAKLYSEPPRTHLGASEIGDVCSRRLWYKFRWFAFEQHTPRMQRLFNRGHKEEARVNEWLSLAGYRVMPVDPATGKQWRVSAVMGHFGGSTDGVAYLPEAYGIDTPFLLEYKTNGTGPGFSNLLRNGVQLEKPQHFDQQSYYGFKLGLTHSIYINTCKNDDNMHVEVIKLNHGRAADLERKAEVIILAQEPPPRIAENKTFHVCKFCFFNKHCFDSMPPVHNCRSCKKAQPIDGAAWGCNHWGQVIPADVIPKGCDQWEPLA